MQNSIFRNGHKILISYEKQNPLNCPVNEKTADGEYVGACTFYLKNGITCPRHGIVKDKEETKTPHIKKLNRFNLFIDFFTKTKGSICD